MNYEPSDGTWQIGHEAEELRRLKKELSEKDYADQKRAFKKFMCGYFSNGKCDTSQGSTISPIGATKKGGKILKVRWAYPGCGKSGSMRLVVVVFCEAKRVHITGAFPRRSNPSDSELLDTTLDL